MFLDPSLNLTDDKIHNLKYLTIELHCGKLKVGTLFPTMLAVANNIFF